MLSAARGRSSPDADLGIVPVRRHQFRTSWTTKVVHIACSNSALFPEKILKPDAFSRDLRSNPLQNRVRPAMPPNSSRRVSTFSFSPRTKARRAAGGGEVNEDVCEWPHAGLLATEWALFTRGFAYGELVVIAPADLSVQLPEDGEMVDTVFLWKGRDGLVGAANAALPYLVQELLLTLVFRALPYGFESVQELVLGRPKI